MHKYKLGNDWQGCCTTEGNLEVIADDKVNESTMCSFGEKKNQ